jgi:hypothetical protein
MSCTPLVTSMRAGGRRRTARQPTADDARISRQFSVWPRVLVDRLRRTLSTVGSPRQFARPGGVASAGFWPASLRPCRNGRLLHFVHLRHDSLRGPERRQDRHCRLPSGRGPIRRRCGRSVAGLATCRFLRSGRPVPATTRPWPHHARRPGELMRVDSRWVRSCLAEGKVDHKLGHEPDPASGLTSSSCSFECLSKRRWADRRSGPRRASGPSCRERGES